MPEWLKQQPRSKSLKIWRIGKARHADTHWDGIGNRFVDSRWIRAGRSVTHAAGSLALAQLEVLVHLPRQRVANRIAWAYASATIPPAVTILRARVSHLPSHWSTDASEMLDELRHLGTQWYEDALSAVLAVPSALSPADSDINYLLNPVHEDYQSIQFNEPRTFAFDARLGSKLRESDRTT